MSSMPECTKCGAYVHSGPVLCEKCMDDLRAELAQAQETNLNNVTNYQLQVKELQKELIQAKAELAATQSWTDEDESIDES